MSELNEFNTLAELQQQTIGVVAEQMQNNLKANRSIASGNLFRSISPQQTVNKEGSINSVLEIKAWYAELVDQGIDPRGPGRQPPIYPIQQWIKRKSISVPSGLSIESFAFAIAKKIAKQGQKKKAYPFIQPAIKRGEEFFINNVNDAVEVDVEVNTQEILTSSPYIKSKR
jgi:hypothetical protein